MSNNQIASNFFDEPSFPRRTRLQDFWAVFKKNRLAIAGLLMFGVFFVAALIGLFLTSGHKPVFDPALVRLQEKLRPPLSKANCETLRPDEIPVLGLYLLGTDDLGRDVFVRMFQGAWVSLTVGFVAVMISVLVGIIMGGMAGYFGDRHVYLDHMLFLVLALSGLIMTAVGQIPEGVLVFIPCLVYFVFKIILARSYKIKMRRWWVNLLHKKIFSVDTLIMRIVDIMLCFPSFFLILTVVALLPASIYNIMIIIGLTSWMGTTRFVRAEFLSLKDQDFVTAARALGISDLRIIFRHIMPNAIAPVLVSSTIGIATAILTEAGLSFLGFGVPPPHATWGNILSDGKGFLFDAPWLTFIPGIAILIAVLSFNLFGEGIRDTLNPKLRDRV
ncbi:MAG TPA: ABC transporter permease [Desulfobacteraceae bacterium]|nr:ABC transporter permease [Desulfobacteraceae bacterium]